MNIFLLEKSIEKNLITFYRGSAALKLSLYSNHFERVSFKQFFKFRIKKYICRNTRPLSLLYPGLAFTMNIFLLEKSIEKNLITFYRGSAALKLSLYSNHFERVSFKQFFKFRIKKYICRNIRPLSLYCLVDEDLRRGKIMPDEKKTWHFDYRPCSLAKQGDNALDSVRPSVHPSVCPPVSALTPGQVPMFGVQWWNKNEKNREGHYQSEVFVCVSTISRGCVDRLLIQFYFFLRHDQTRTIDSSISSALWVWHLDQVIQVIVKIDGATDHRNLYIVYW